MACDLDNESGLRVSFGNETKAQEGRASNVMSDGGGGLRCLSLDDLSCIV